MSLIGGHILRHTMQRSFMYESDEWSFMNIRMERQMYVYLFLFFNRIQKAWSKSDVFASTAIFIIIIITRRENFWDWTSCCPMFLNQFTCFFFCLVTIAQLVLLSIKNVVFSPLNTKHFDYETLVIIILSKGIHILRKHSFKNLFVKSIEN